VGAARLGRVHLVFCGSALAAFALESRPLALIAVAALTVQFCTHLAVSVVAYRRIMRRPWPAVPPREDDDD
jgi:membrane protein implicated in regulation of membrane protease activity